MPRSRPSPIVIGMQPHTEHSQYIKSPRERTKEMLPRRFEAVVRAMRAMHTLGSASHHDLRATERKRIVATLQQELQGVEAALEGRPGTLSTKIFDDD